MPSGYCASGKTEPKDQQMDKHLWLKEAGIETHYRVHDLRHAYVVNSIRAGDDIKTVQTNAGHYSAAFILDRYAHVTETMKKESAARMQAFIDSI